MTPGWPFICLYPLGLAVGATQRSAIDARQEIGNAYEFKIYGMKAGLAMSALAWLLFSGSVQGFAAGQTYHLGSADTVTADPQILRPASVPCRVQLFDHLAFEDFNPKAFSYEPPADCPGPWRRGKVLWPALAP